MSVDILSLATKMNGKGVEFNTIIRKSPLLSILFYDARSLYVGDQTNLQPKMLTRSNYFFSDDGVSTAWRDVDLRPTNTTVNDASASAGDTTLTVADASMFTVGCQVYVPSTRQTFTISSISSNTLTFTDAIATGGIADGAGINLISYAIGSGGSGKSVTTMASDEVTNYLQDDSRKMSFSQQQLNKLYLMYATEGASMEMIANKMVAYQIEQSRAELFKDIARAFYAGDKKTGTIGSEVRYYAGGFQTYYTTNTDCTGSSAKDAWYKIQDAIRPIQEIDTLDGTSDVVLCCSHTAAQKISNMGYELDIIRETGKMDFLGTRVTTLSTISGDVHVITDPSILDVDGYSANVAYAFKPGLVRLVSTPINMTAFDVSSDMAKVGNYEGLVLHAKPQQQVNYIELELFTNFSFIFGGSTVGAGARLYNLGVSS